MAYWKAKVNDHAFTNAIAYNIGQNLPIKSQNMFKLGRYTNFSPAMRYCVWLYMEISMKGSRLWEPHTLEMIHAAIA